MAKYLVLYRSTISAEEQMGASSAEVARAGMELWMNWAGRAGRAIADMGSPLGAVATVRSSGATPASGKPPFIGGFSILEADSVEDVERVVDGHPHFHSPGDPSIEVLEFLPMPEV